MLGIIAANTSTDLAVSSQDALSQAFAASGVGNAWLIPETGNKNNISRLSLYVAWLEKNGKHWTSPDLSSYADAMIERGLSASSAKAHLSTMRGQFRKLISNPSFKHRVRLLADTLYPSKSESDKRALYLTVIETVQDGLNPLLTSQIKATQKQDKLDNEHTRLTQSQAESLIHMPGLDTLRCIRDTAILYLMLATGLREAEVCGLNVADIRQKSGNELGVQVKHGKGSKQRFVPYGDLSDCLVYVDAWLAQTNITSGKVFRGFKDKHTPNYAPNEHSPSLVYSRLRDGLNVRQIQNIFKGYPVSIDGQLRHIRPHDTRRSYAKLLWDNGMDIIAIRQNLGHVDIKTTQTYIGNMDMSKRRAPKMISPSHDRKQLAKLVNVSKLL